MGRHVLETNILSNADKAHIRGTENFPSWPTLQMKYILIQRNTFKREYQGLSWYTHKSLVVKYSSSKTGWMTEQPEESMWRNIWSKWCNQQLHPLISFFLLCCGCSLNVCFQFSVVFFLRKITNISEKSTDAEWFYVFCDQKEEFSFICCPNTEFFHLCLCFHVSLLS